MATIKSYTDIPQSKKLAEILPLETADMYYPNRTDVKYQGALPIEFKHGNPLLSQEIAAWSLAALLGILPKVINNETLFIETSPALWHIGYRNVYIARTDNLIDACYEMILKLHELKML